MSNGGFILSPGEREKQCSLVKNCKLIDALAD